MQGAIRPRLNFTKVYLLDTNNASDEANMYREICQTDLSGFYSKV